MNRFSSFFFSLLLTGGVMYSQSNTFPSSGNTGVGTTNPGEKLEVVGNTKVKGDLIVTDTTKLKGDVRIDGQLKLKHFNSTTTTADRLLGINPNGKVIDNPSILNLNTYRLSPLAGDSIIRFGDSTLLIYPGFNRIWADQSVTIKGIGISNGTAQGAYATAIGYGSAATGAYGFSAGEWVSAFGQNTMVLGSGLGSSQRLSNSIPQSLMIGFNSNVPTLFVSSSTGPGTTGVVCIGTTTMPPGTQYKLAVAGTILGHELEVITPAQWPDYVFEKDYPLMSLEERHSFISKNKHLPWIRSASELSDNGLAVSELLSGLTKNVEELTLYILQLKNELNMLKSELETLKGK